ncbi:ABC transporter substrate-binding protein [Azoarcus olearius]|uniref:Conserved hypothetical secreted protein n=1 Tax=Azoarcus sp. (strain BH72) TaxID=418699 RepID=A1K6P0_AZOSB|nr:ABC transporter substrate binding protein [Azoarcus olearius]CAL94495.1 conserved hypothetical secreted protein [Azoarcus olearius]
MTTGLLRFALLLCTALSGLVSLPARALDVAVVLAQSEGTPRAFADALRSVLPESQHRLTLAGAVDAGLNEAAIARADVVLAAGVAAAEAVASRTRRPMLAVLLSRQQFANLRARYPTAPMSAIVLDQPLRRQLKLVRAVLPNATRVGVLLGPESGALETELTDAAAGEGLQLRSQQVLQSGDVLAAAERLLDASDALLAIPDPVATNPASARAVLLSSYRFRRPMLAYSQAYVEAGALAAVFSSPSDVALDVADWLATQGGGSVSLPAARSPSRFGVAVNRQVARSLGLTVAEDLALVRAMGSGGGR